jgi:RND family efflux transporter MFP subunit
MVGFFEEKIEPHQGAVAQAKATAEQLANAYTVREVQKDYIAEAVGTLKAADRTEISARVMAPIDDMKVRAGQMVAEGDLLVVLDSRALETQRSQAAANLVAAQAAVKRAAADYERDKKLAATRAVSAEQLDQTTEKLRVAQANLDHAEEALAEADVMLSYTAIHAPKPGMIVDRMAEKGDMARPGEPLLILYDPRSLRLEVPVMENLAVNLKQGDELEVEIEARNRKITGTVDEIVPQAEAASRSFLVKLALPRSDDLFEGMFGRLRIPAGRRRHVCLHTAAIEPLGQLQFVTVIGDGDVLERRFIKTGRFGDANHREVLSGLEPGERVVRRPYPPAGAQPAQGDAP